MTKSIVISGPPAVGKTTVAKGLAEEFQLQYLSGIGDIATVYENNTGKTR